MAYRVLEFPRRLYRQPQGAVEVDWSNPRTRGLQFAFYGSLVEAVSRRLPAVQTGTIIPTELGLAANATSAATGFRWDLPTTISGTTPITVMASQLCYASNTTVKNLFRLDDSSGGFAAGFRHGNGSTNLYYALVASTTDSFGITRSSVKTPSLNVRRTTAYYHSGATATRPVFWVDGEQETTSDASGTGTRRSISRVVLLNGNLSSQVFNGNVPWLYLFDREVPVEEQAEIFANPWQLLRAQPRRVYVRLPGGATTHQIAIDTVAEALSEIAITRTAQVAADTVAEADSAAAITRTTQIAADTVAEADTSVAITRTVSLTADSAATAESALAITRGVYLTLDTVAFAVSEVEITIEGAGATTHQISIDTAAIAESAVAITRTAELAIDTVAEASSALTLGITYALQADTVARAESVVALGVTWQLLGVDSRALAESSVNVTIGIPPPPGIPLPPLVTSLTHVAELTLQAIGSVRLVQATQGPPEVPFDVTVQLTRPAITVRQQVVTRQS